jgi:aryl carrier-like protein
VAPSARDKKTLLTLIEQAQLVYLLTRYPRKQVLDDPADAKRLGDGLDGMRAAAKDLSASLRESHAAIAWDELAQTPETPELLWRRAKRLAPTVLRELVPLLEGTPEAAFFLRPEQPAGRAPKGKGAKAKGRSADGAKPKARSANGTPAAAKTAKTAKSKAKRAR